MELEVNKMMEEIPEHVENIEKTVNEAQELIQDTKKLSVRFRDFMVRVVVRIGKIITCNKVSLSSRCCEKIENHNETIINNTTNNNSPPLSSHKVTIPINEFLQLDPAVQKLIQNYNKK